MPRPAGDRRAVGVHPNGPLDGFPDLLRAHELLQRRLVRARADDIRNVRLRLQPRQLGRQLADVVLPPTDEPRRGELHGASRAIQAADDGHRHDRLGELQLRRIQVRQPWIGRREVVRVHRALALPQRLDAPLADHALVPRPRGQQREAVDRGEGGFVEDGGPPVPPANGVCHRAPFPAAAAHEPRRLVVQAPAELVHIPLQLLRLQRGESFLQASKQLFQARRLSFISSSSTCI